MGRGSLGSTAPDPPYSVLATCHQPLSSLLRPYHEAEGAPPFSIGSRQGFFSKKSRAAKATLSRFLTSRLSPSPTSITVVLSHTAQATFLYIHPLCAPSSKPYAATADCTPATKASTVIQTRNPTQPALALAHPHGLTSTKPVALLSTPMKLAVPLTLSDTKPNPADLVNLLPSPNEVR